MKKYFFLASCAALALCSCSNEIDETDEIPLMNSNEIRINTYVPGMTRANEVEAFKDGDIITVLATTTVNEKKSNIINNKNFLYNGSNWSSNDSIFSWPDDLNQKVAFYGTYSAGSEQTLENDSIWIVSTEGSYDLMTAYKEDSYNTSSNGVINLSFNHILSDVYVTVKGAKDGYDYQIQNISVSAPFIGYYNVKANQYITDYPGDDHMTEDYSFEVPQGATISTTATACSENLMIIPGTSTVKVNYTYNVKGASEVKEVPALEGTVTFEKGKKYTLTITLTPGAEEIILDANVQKWEDAGNVDPFATTEIVPGD